MKIVEDWLLAFRPTYQVHLVKVLILEERQIQVIEEQATGEAQLGEVTWTWLQPIAPRQP